MNTRQAGKTHSFRKQYKRSGSLWSPSQSARLAARVLEDLEQEFGEAEPELRDRIDASFGISFGGRH